MAYIAVENRLLNRFCGDGNLCFWIRVALVHPYERKDAYLFDCALYRFARKEYRDTPETRLLLSFKSPIAPGELAFSGNLGYAVIGENEPCDAKTVCDCILSALEYVETRLEEVGRELKQLYDHSESLRRVVPLPVRDRSVLKGIYYGLRVKQSILKDIASRMGYAERALRAHVKPLFILVSLNLNKKKYTALLQDVKIELKAHNKLVDPQEIFNVLGSASTI